MSYENSDSKTQVQKTTAGTLFCLLLIVVPLVFLFVAFGCPKPLFTNGTYEIVTVSRRGNSYSIEALHTDTRKVKIIDNIGKYPLFDSIIIGEEEKFVAQSGKRILYLTEKSYAEMIIIHDQRFFPEAEELTEEDKSRQE